MNKSKLKSYAPQARKDFIAAVTARANLLGLSEAGGNLEVAPGERKGDIAIIAGREWPVKLYEQRERLIKHMNTVGFSQAVEAVAYTWFNRFAALRYMEIHDYLDHGHRVLSNREGGMPEILNHATELDLPGLNKDKAIELKLAGNKDGDLYKMLLAAQCNALSNAMPFLFEHIDDETELLLPDNLLRTDSIIAKLVEAIPEEDWQEVEIIGWLYQFYISEKKDEVIGKVVKSEDIPAATQLFTPNWIVQYLVQNSVGRLWLMANPASTLKSQWLYYIEPAEQTPDVGAAFAAITQTRMDEDGGSLNPETITMLDPACGSGHILVVGYDVLKAIYLERGYQLRAIPRLILEKNLYGLDIDGRAAQMAGFALLMKARADDRRLFDNPPKLNVLALQESKGLNADEIAQALSTVRAEHVEAHHIRLLIDTFAHAKTFGSLTQIPPELNAQLATMSESLKQVIEKGDLYAQAAAQDLLPLVQQARVLGMQYDAVVANPPYMGGKGMNAALKDYTRVTFPDSKSDLFAMFIERGFGWCKPGGFNSMVTMQSWMFLGSFKGLREKIISNFYCNSLVHIGYNSFPELNSKIAQACMFCFINNFIQGAISRFIDLTSSEPSSDKRDEFLNHSYELAHDQDQSSFTKLPGTPIAFQISEREKDAFSLWKLNGDICETSNGVQTGDNSLFVREWFEVSKDKMFVKWFPYNKGGPYKKWYGNAGSLIDWESGGERIKSRENSCYRGEHLYFKPCITWTDITWRLSGRFLPSGFISDAAGPCAYFFDDRDMYFALGVMNTPLADEWSKLINPTLHFQAGDFKKLPLSDEYKSDHVMGLVHSAIELTKIDLNEIEVSQGFLRSPLVCEEGSLPSAFLRNNSIWKQRILNLEKLENENLDILMKSFRIFDRQKPTIKGEWLTLECNPMYLFGKNREGSDLKFREKVIVDFVSYAIGCMMGRYSLDEPGLIYAHAGNVGFDATRYQTFPADADGIVPLTDDLWFEDDAANRIREFLRSVWGADTLEENLTWLAESLGKKGNETSDETIRRYLSGSFFKDHLQTYKKRPIYWLFSSGKQGAFQALVYLHRYHEGTLARMRSEYVVPLTGKIQSRIEMLSKDAEAATSTAARNKLNKEIEGLRKKHVELLTYDEKLRHYADMRIKLDLDDGVKVNYGKFGDLLAEVKAVTGGASDD